MNSNIRKRPFHIKPSKSQKDSLILDDSEEGLVLSATKKFIPHLPEKLKNIFTESIKSIHRTEKYHRKQIYEILPYSNIIGEKSFSEKIRLLGEKKFLTKKPHTTIQAEYIKLFTNIQQLIFDYGIIQQSKTEGKYTTPNNKIIEETIIDSFYKNDYLADERYQNLIISRLFSIQINFYELLNSYNNVADKEDRKNIAKFGGDTKNYGEHILFKNILNHFLENRPAKNEKSSSIAFLHRKHYKNLESTLEKYQKKIGTREEGSRHFIYYGSNLTTDGLLRKIREWCKKEQDLKKEIEEYHLKPKKKKITPP
ncbi:hypothetical protein [Comamonas sp.]|uniref:hypothetical protein n=1 Tax=Comamonas sp. TaxID=34028 RepID=UPI0012D202C2|nr:hypothetical protein [Comamonas sp.]MPS96580.1 hypothetical protein [Comamonas sp.]